MWTFDKEKHLEKDQAHREKPGYRPDRPRQDLFQLQQDDDRRRHDLTKGGRQDRDVGQLKFGR